MKIGKFVPLTKPQIYERDIQFPAGAGSEQQQGVVQCKQAAFQGAAGEVPRICAAAYRCRFGVG